MGSYINPVPPTSKEVWLALNATHIARDNFSWENTPENHLPVVWVNNGWMTAAGICFSQREFQAFTDPNDKRARMYFYAPIDKLLEVSDLERFLQRGT